MMKRERADINRWDRWDLRGKNSGNGPDV